MSYHSNPNLPTWECHLCKFRNSNLRDVCIDCGEGTKKKGKFIDPATEGYGGKHTGRLGGSNKGALQWD